VCCKILYECEAHRMHGCRSPFPASSYTCLPLTLVSFFTRRFLRPLTLVSYFTPFPASSYTCLPLTLVSLLHLSPYSHAVSRVLLHLSPFSCRFPCPLTLVSFFTRRNTHYSRYCLLSNTPTPSTSLAHSPVCSLTTSRALGFREHPLLTSPRVM